MIETETLAAFNSDLEQAPPPDEVTPEPTPETPPVEDTSEPPVETPAEKLYAGKYKTPEDLEAAYKNIEFLQGRTSAELSELRELRSAIEEMRTQQQTVPQQIPGNLDELISENPAQVAEWARHNQQGPVYEAAMAEWYDQNPKDASRYEQNLRVEQMREEFAQAQTPVYQTLLEQQREQQFTAIAREHPDLPDYVERIAEIAATKPLLARALTQGEPAEQVEAIKTLYEIAKATSAPTVDTQTQAKDLARVMAEETERAKAEAGVIPAGTATQGEPGTPDPAQTLYESWENLSINRLR